MRLGDDLSIPDPGARSGWLGAGKVSLDYAQVRHRQPESRPLPLRPYVLRLTVSHVETTALQDSRDEVRIRYVSAFLRRIYPWFFLTRFLPQTALPTAMGTAAVTYAVELRLTRLCRSCHQQVAASKQGIRVLP